jgi:hypothetical protein
MTRRLAPVLVLVALAATACNDNGGDGSTVETTSPPVTTPATTPPTSAPGTPAASSTCPSQSPLPAGATLVTATVTGGKVSTDHAVWTVRRGTPVRVAVTADVADEVHVHTYDRKENTKPGCPTAIDFVAAIPGTVEVELESKGLHLFDLRAR